MAPMGLRSRIPSGPIERKWEKHLFEMKLVLATIRSRWQLGPAHHRVVKHGRRMLTAGPGENMRLIPLRERALRGKAAPPTLVPTP